MQYLVTLHGFLELVSREAAASVARLTPSDLEHSAAEPESPGKEVIEWYLADPSRRAVTQLLKPLNLRTHLQTDPIEVDADELAAELFAEHRYLLPWIARAGGMLLILAWETCKSSSDRTPVWEFLRHCRNAAAHGSAFNFVGPEPKRPAVWGELSISRGLQGSPLFREKPNGLLMTGDPVRLLWDIEQSYPGLPPAPGVDVPLDEKDEADG